LGDLKTLLRSTPDWIAISPSQRKSYERAFEAIKRRWPDQTALRGVMDNPKMRPVIMGWFQGFKERPATANMHKAGLSKLLSFGVDRGVLERNVALRIRRISTESRAGIVWSPEHIALARGKMPPEFAGAVFLAYSTAQRQGDLVGLTWNDVKPDGVTFRPAKQQKRFNQRLMIPMYEELEAALALIPKRGVHVLTTKAGRPWNIHTFRHEFRNACRAAGLPENLHFHDLRGSALKAFADAGASELEIRAISGHSMKSLPGALGSYIDSWISLAESAVRKRENVARTKSANGGRKRQARGRAKRLK
jgi:integrase